MKRILARAMVVGNRSDPFQKDSAALPDLEAGAGVNAVGQPFEKAE
ncbi:hypothetical protein [Roseovarius litorisediminis]|nr:hypothetical protein [Roseovarius litorisediminis]